MASPLPADPLAVGAWLDELEAADALPRELAECASTAHPPLHHYEGDVYRHTRLALAYLPQAAARVGVAPTLDQAAAVLCHDIGKPSCADYSAGTFYGHDKVGAAMVPAFLDRIDPDGRVDREKVAWCVREHLFWLHADIDLVRDTPVARRYCREDGWGRDLRVVNLCDGLASWGPSGVGNLAFLERVQAKIEEVCARIEAERRRPRPVLDGHEVMALRGIPPGPEVGEWLARIQRAGIRDAEEAREFLRRA